MALIPPAEAAELAIILLTETGITRKAAIARLEKQYGEAMVLAMNESRFTQAERLLQIISALRRA